MIPIAPNPQPAAAARPRPGLLRTFLVEDSPLLREGLVAALEELGPIAVVGAAADEGSALQWLARPAQAVDLVIVDLFLQSGSGLAVLRALRRQASPPHVVVLSNFVGADVRITCLALGAEHVFDKSHEIDALVAYCTALAARVPPPALPHG